jgi:hypothetical protein
MPKPKIEVNLSLYQCPQLFVQFKWQLKKAEQANSNIHFFYLKEQDIGDIVRYLSQHSYSFKKHDGAEPSIEVHISNV